jgi:hypothetical protein
MGAKREDNEVSGTPFPGTGGDFVDGNDVEGHRVPRLGPEDAIRREGDDALRRDADPLRRDGEDAARRLSDAEDDVEGHRVPRYGPQDAIRREDDEAARRWPAGEEQDVEGHLYRNLPTTQGEIIRRGPGDNPHGER